MVPVVEVEVGRVRYVVLHVRPYVEVAGPSPTAPAIPDRLDGQLHQSLFEVAAQLRDGKVAFVAYLEHAAVLTPTDVFAGPDRDGAAAPAVKYARKDVDAVTGDWLTVASWEELGIFEVPPLGFDGRR